MLIIKILAAVYLLSLPKAIRVYKYYPKELKRAYIDKMGNKYIWFLSIWLAVPLVVSRITLNKLFK